MINTTKFLLLAALIGAAGGPALAARVDKNAPLYKAMDEASQRYRTARIKLQAGDDAGMAQMGKALEDLEELAQQCLKQRGCESTRVITQYEVLLKGQDMDRQQSLTGEDDDDSDEPDHAPSPILTNSPEARRSLTILNDGHRFDTMVQVNEPVKAALREWLTTQRSFLIDAWENYQYMRYLMAPEYERTSLPEALLFGIMAKESGGKVHAISRSGASGPLQFMPATGSRFGLYRDGTGFDSRFDPQQAARANAAYVNERFAELNRNLEFTIAAYNGGEGRAARLYAASGGASFWSPEVYSQLPAETRDYVPAVIAAAWLFLHPKKYGLEFPKLDTTPDQFQVARTTSINELTICLGNGGSRDGWFRVLRNLNPRYEAGATILAGTTLRAPKRVTALYRTRCVQGNRADIAADLVRASNYIAAAAPLPVSPMANAWPNNKTDPLKRVPRAATPENSKGKVKSRTKTQVRSYRVRSGDSLIEIAREHNCDMTQLAKENRLKGPAYRIRPGLRIKLSGCEE